MSGFRCSAITTCAAALTLAGAAAGTAQVRPEPQNVVSSRLASFGGLKRGRC